MIRGEAREKLVAELRTLAQEWGRRCGYVDITNRELTQRQCKVHDIEPINARLARRAIWEKIVARGAPKSVATEAVGMYSEPWAPGTDDLADTLGTIHAFLAAL